MNAHKQDEALEAMLSAEEPYIDDAGFTARVMQRLPRRRQLLGFSRAAILLGASATAALVLLLNRPLCVELNRAFSAVLAGHSAGSLPFASVVMVVMLLFAGVTAMQRE